MDTNALTELCTLAQYRAGREHIFPSATSLDWQIRLHREELARQGALLLVGNRRMVNPPIFDRVILEAAQRAMAAKLTEAA